MSNERRNNLSELMRIVNSLFCINKLLHLKIRRNKEN